MAPQRGPVNFGLDPKSPQIRNKIKLLSFILCLTTVTTYRTKPSSEMTAHQGPSNTYYTTPNALPRDIRVRGSKPVNHTTVTNQWNIDHPTTHTQPSNTEKHHTHPRNNEDTNTQQTPSTKNYYLTQLFRKGTEINKPSALHTNDLQDMHQQYRETQQTGSNTWKSQNFPTYSHPRRTCHKNNTKTINKTQTNHTSTRNFNPASIWGSSPPLSLSEEAAIFILTPTNHKQPAAPRQHTSPT